MGKVLSYVHFNLKIMHFSEILLDSLHTAFFKISKYNARFELELESSFYGPFPYSDSDRYVAIAEFISTEQ